MWLYTVLVGICVLKNVYLAEIPSVASPGAAISNHSSPANSNNDLDDDNDDYLPSLDWSDTFDWQLLKIISSEYKGNILISPLSLKLALVMLYEGSAGSTEKQFQSVLQFSGQKSEVREKYKNFLEILLNNRKDYVLNIGTSLFLDSSISPNQQYAATIKSAYDTDIQSTNFSRPIDASNTINSWVDFLTNGRIRELVSAEEIHSDDLLVVANAVYFKGRWRRQFPMNNTHSGGFYVTPTNVVTVSYMALTDKFYYGESKELDSKILRLPYKGKHFSLFLVLPNSKGGLPDLIKSVNLATLKRQLYLMDERTVDVVIPKFKFDFTSTYSKVLQDFGLTTIFSNTASFPSIARGVGSGTKWLFVNDIKQRAGIEVNEEGSTAYASTAIQLGNKFGDAELSFNATHPFLIFLEDQITGTILFAGKVENPLQSDPLPSRFGDSNGDPKPVTTAPVTTAPVTTAPVTTAPVTYTTEAQQHQGSRPVASPDYSANSIALRFNYFDIHLMRTFDDSKNYFISPASIKATLGMVLEGARGKSANEITTILGLPSDPSQVRETLQGLLYRINAKSSTTLLEDANAVFTSDAYQLVPEFRQNLNKFYHAHVQPLNFADSQNTAATINKWVSDKTQHHISEIVQPGNISPDAAVVLLNALYFKGKWTHAFDEKSTSLKCFRNTRSNCIKTKMMQITKTFKYKALDNAQAVQLPYGDEEYAMLVMVPNEKSSVESLIFDLTHTPFSSVVNSLEPVEVMVSLPVFSIHYTADLVADLQNLNIREVFGQNANLSGMIQGGQVKINNVVHKASIEVNEKGTVASAVTMIDVIPLMGTSMPRFDADHPFLFFIYHVRTNNIIFEGRFNEPEDAYKEIFNGPGELQTSNPARQPVQPQRQPVQPQRQPVQPQRQPVVQEQRIQQQDKQQQAVSLSLDSAPPRQASGTSEQVFYPTNAVIKPGSSQQSYTNPYGL